MSSKKVLIIEQDAQLARQMSEVLARSGYETIIQEDGVAGLQAARDLLPDAIVLCVEVPKMSGFAVCHKMKKMPELQNIPLMLTSAEATEESFAKHKELKTRADAYLIKPYDMNRFKAEFDAMLGGGQAGAGLDADGFGDILQEMDEHLDSEVSASLDNLIDTSLFGGGESVPDPMPDLEFMPSAEIEIIRDEEEDAPKTPVAAEPAAEEDGFTMEVPNLPPKRLEPGEQDWVNESAPAPEPQAVSVPVPEPEAPASKPVPKPAEKPRRATSSTPKAEAGTPVAPMESASLSASLGLDALAESAAPAALTEELENLRREKDRLTRELAQAKSSQGSSFSKEKEFLSLRETINQKEKQIIDLREEVDNKEQEILKKKNQIRELERQIADLNSNGLELERRSVELGEQLAQANATIAERDGEVADLRSQVARLSADTARLEKELAQVQAAKAAVEAEYRETVERLNREHAEKVAGMESAHAAEVERLRTEHATLLSATNSAHEAQVAGLHADYRGQLAAQKQSYESQLQEAREAHASEVAQLKEAHAGEVAGLHADYRGQLAAQKQSYESQLQEAREAHASEVAQLKEAHARALAEAAQTLEDTVAGLKEAHASEVADLNAAHEQAMQAASTRHGQELAALVKQHNEQKAAAEKAHQEEIARIKAEHAAQMQQNAEAAARQLAETIADFESRLDAERDAHAATKQALEGQITELNAAKERLEEKVFNLEQVRMQNEAAIDDLNTQVADLTDQLNAANERIAGDHELVLKAVESMKKLAQTLHDRFSA